MQLAECIKVNANYSTIYTAIVEGHSDTCKTAAVNFADTFHDMQMSAAAVKTIKKAVNVILYLSRQAHYKAAFNKAAHKQRLNKDANNVGCTTKRQQALQYKAKREVRDSYLCTFLTLTLPAKQTHSDIEITKYCLNPFLTYARKIWGVRHYIWKKELQQNGNLHYHLVTDRYVDALCLRKAWNRLINRGLVKGCNRPFDYVDRYTYRMKDLYSDGWNDEKVLAYIEKSNAFKGSTRDEIKAFEKQQDRAATYAEILQIESRLKYAELERYKKAYLNEIQYDSSVRWTSPNSTDISAIRTPRSVSAYVAKYIAKAVDESPELSEYFEQVSHYKDMIKKTLTDMYKRQQDNLPPDADDEANLKFWKDALHDARKFCPIQGKLWFKSATLTPFVSGLPQESTEIDPTDPTKKKIIRRNAVTIIDGETNNEIQRLMDYLKERERSTGKPQILFSYGRKEDGTIDTNNIICITLLINIFQLQMAKHNRRLIFPNLVRLWQRFVFDCKHYNTKRGLYRRHIELETPEIAA